MSTNFRTIMYVLEGKPTFELTGEIDGSSAAEICYQIETLELPACSLDFSRVEAIDIFAARVLARGLKALRDRGVRFEVEGLPEPVAGTLCLGGVLEALV